MSDNRCILTLSCRNQPGIVSAVTTQLFTAGCDIAESSQFDDGGTGRFFMRLVFGLGRDGGDLDALRGGFEAIARRFTGIRPTTSSARGATSSAACSPGRSIGISMAAS